MHVAIDTTPLRTGHKLRGIGSYTENLISALKKYEPKHSYHFFTRGQIVPKNVDLVHYPYFEPFFLTLPFKKPKPTVVTVHDLIPIVWSQHFPRGVRGDLKWKLQRLSLARTKIIITDSVASKEDIYKTTGFPQERIRVVYLAPSELFSGSVRSSKNLDLPDRFILYVGDVNWNKNIAGLLGSFSVVRENIPNVKFVLVGKQFLNTSLKEVQSINKRISELSIEQDVVRLGFVKDRDLPTVYRRASVYVQPSFAEGFGFPVLEAMACECPVVCSNASSLAEIAGPSITVRPNAEDIAVGVKRVFTMSKNERRELVKSETLWVKRFSWKKVAKETVAAYEKALE